MPDPLEEAQSMAYALDTRSVYTRIGKRSFFLYTSKYFF
jgi:hypothetical protein